MNAGKSFWSIIDILSIAIVRALLKSSSGMSITAKASKIDEETVEKSPKSFLQNKATKSYL